MSVATEITHGTRRTIRVFAMSESSSEQSKADKKREYNRNAQRMFRARRKAHLNELEQAQRESSSAQTQEVERLRRENHQLTLENESLRAAYGSATSSPGPTVSPVNPRGSPSHLLPYGPPGAFLEAATAGSLPSSAVSTAPSTSSEASNLVVVVPNNIREIRRALHRLFAPIHEIPVVSNPQSHFATLAALAPSLPTSLKPTELQLSQPHNVYIDMIPSPRLRDRLIAIGPANSTTFIMQVCTIVYDVEDTGQMTIWGEDWLNEFSWEFSAPVLERWGGWLLTSEWGQRANFWRRQRGAPILPGALKEHQYDPEEEMMRTGYSCAPVSPSFWWQSEYACTVQAAILH